MNDQGFTLIELLIVSAIIAILLAIGIPNLLGARRESIKTASYAYARSCSTAIANYALNNPGVNIVGLRCTDTQLNVVPPPGYVNRTLMVDQANIMALEYDYVINGAVTTASIPMDLK